MTTKQHELAYPDYNRLIGEGSPESALICAVLTTFFIDMNHLIQREIKLKSKKKPKWHVAYLQNFSPVYSNLHAKKDELIQHAKSTWIRSLCDLINLDHDGFVERLMAQVRRGEVMTMSSHGVEFD